MNEQHTALNQLFANLYSMSKAWYEIRDKKVDIEDMKMMFELCLKNDSLMENARQGRNMMARLKLKYEGFAIKK